MICERAGTASAVPAPEHNYTSTVLAPTCEAMGYTLHECACGDSYKDTYVPAVGHNYVQTGTNTYTCTRCGKVNTGVILPIDPEPPVSEISLTADEGCTRTVATSTVEEHSYIYTGGKLMRETISVDGTVTTVMDFIYDVSGRPFALRYSDDGGKSFDTYYYVLNLQGDVVKLVWYIPGFEYKAVATYTYDAWGNILSATGDMAEINPLRYRGYYYDSETGFYYLQSRYYDPVNHRFINADIYVTTDATNAIGCNMFAYCGNNPVTFIDPEGTNDTRTKTKAKNAIVCAVLFLLGYAASSYASRNTRAATKKITKDTPIEEVLKQKLKPIHSVYFLVDETTGMIKYVGRTTNARTREKIHKKTPGKEDLEMVVVVEGVNYYVARAMEQILMIEAHTHKTLGGLNLINGISPKNRLVKEYMKAGMDYMENLVSNEVLNWIEMIGGLE